MSTRYAAVKALRGIFDRSKKPKDAVNENSSGKDKRERAFLMELVYGVLRYRDYLDYLIAPFIKKPAGLSRSTRDNLRVAVYQLHSLRVPQWAVLNEAVKTEKMIKGKPSVVNAVLRNFLRQKDHIMPLDSGDVLKHISITTSHPRWLVKRWLKRFGYEETLMLARKNNEVPPFVIRVNESERADTVNALLDKGLKAVETHYSPAGIRIDTPLSFEDLDKLCPARFIAQDEAAQLVTYLLDPHPGNRVLDACAAPGGKTTHIVGLMGDKGEIIAVETDEKRVQQLKETVSRTGCTSVKIIQADVRDLHKKFGMFDKILLDAPCSSTGVIRRNPDIKYRHALRDLQRLKKMQIDLLTAVASVLKAGGELVYSVCSTEPEEGEEVLKEFLKTFPNFSIIKSHTNLFDAFESVEAGVQGNTAYRMYPHRHDMDGFFAAKLRRIS